MSAPIIGIDLGTTNSAVAILQGDGAVLLPNALGRHLTPSVVSLDDDGVLHVGDAAHARLATAPDRTAAAFKRDMGTEVRVRIGSKEFSPQQLSALVLKSLKADAEAYLGHPVEEAVVTVPAYFNDSQRQATRAAGEIAGLRVDRIINEPTAAALAYGLHALDEEIQAVVLDLGGGTFDVTVLEIIEGVIEIQSSAGDSRLGGEDFADRLATRAAARVLAETGADPRTDPGAFARFREACERAKRRLSDESITRIVVPALTVGGRTLDVDLEITREDVEAWWQPLLERIEKPIRRALSDAKLRPNEVDEVLLVGGATRTPAVRALAARLFGRLPSHQLPADEAVAMGAAIQAALKEGNEAVDDLVVTDVAPFSMGIGTSTEVGERRVAGIFAPIIERGTVIPCSRSEQFSTISDGQKVIHIEVFQGEHAQTSRNHKLGDYEVRVPPGPAGTEAIDVRFTYDLNGILEVETTVLSTERKSSLVIQNSPGRLSQKQIDSARRDMERLKIHPRDLLPNTVALERADALHAELRADARAALNRAIASFRGALEAQDPEWIDDARAQLNGLVDSLSRGV